MDRLQYLSLGPLYPRLLQLADCDRASSRAGCTDPVAPWPFPPRIICQDYAELAVNSSQQSSASFATLRRPDSLSSTPVANLLHVFRLPVLLLPPADRGSTSAECSIVTTAPLREDARSSIATCCGIRRLYSSKPK